VEEGNWTASCSFGRAVRSVKLPWSRHAKLSQGKSSISLFADDTEKAALEPDVDVRVSADFLIRFNSRGVTGDKPRLSDTEE